MTHQRLKHIAHAGEMGKRVAGFDWASTSLGDPDHWPVELITILQVVLENKNPMYLMWGSEWVQIYNDAYIPVLGSKHPAALGNLHRITWSEALEINRPYIEAVFNGEANLQANVPYQVLFNGKLQERFFSFSSSPVRLHDGRVGGIFAMVTDTTEDIKRVKAFRGYQDQSPIPFLSVAEDWTVDYINPECKKIARAHLGDVEFVGRSIFDIWKGIEGSVFHDHYKLAMKGENQVFEGHYELSNDWLRIFAYPLNPGIGIMTETITASKRLEGELQHAIESRDRFLSIASHELNTPLTSLKLHTQMMNRMQDKGINADRLSRFFMQIDLQIDRLKRLVDDMLDASRIRERRLALNFEEADLRKVVVDTVERFALLYEHAGMKPPELEVSEIDYRCSLDVSRFDQVVSNLITNAFKYGNGTPVKIRLYEEFGRYVLTVKDEGPGVPEHDREKIFEQYYRGNKKLGEGLGLGLFIAKQIIQAHEGNIYLESSPGKGSTFCVKIPKLNGVD